MERKNKPKNSKGNSRLVPKVIAWSLVVLWMGIIFWFSHQPAAESAQLSFRVMRLGGRMLNHWQLAGFAGFVVLFNLFLIWLSRRSTPDWIKGIVLMLFLVCCGAVVYVLYYIIRPRLGVFGLASLNQWMTHQFLRKYAHFFIYFFLGMIVKNALSVSGIKGFNAFAIALGVCAFYAVTDEIHQIFVPGRRALVTDVLIDSAGALVGIIIYSTIDWIAGNRTIWQAFWNITHEETYEEAQEEPPSTKKDEEVHA